jgi:hypothetical protein
MFKSIDTRLPVNVDVKDCLGWLAGNPILNDVIVLFPKVGVGRLWICNSLSVIL